ncbi:hypothetical protein LINGRAHAP2_LOCUS31208 [Linum grandiflorum]
MFLLSQLLQLLLNRLSLLEVDC